MDYIFRRAHIAYDGLEQRGDLAVKDGKIAAIGDLSGISAESEIDAEGKIILPGAVDLGVNLLRDNSFDPPSAEEMTTLSKQAIRGGVTTIIKTMEPEKDQQIETFVLDLVESSLSHSYVDFGYHLLLREWSSERANQLRECLAAGIASVWVARTASASRSPHNALLFSILENMPDGMLAVTTPYESILDEHLRRNLSENGGDPEELFPEWLEAKVISGYPFIMHGEHSRLLVMGLSCALAHEMFAQARESTGKLYAACTLSHLFFNQDSPGIPNIFPPVRGKSDQNQLFASMEEGLISGVVSMHKPRYFEEAAQALEKPATAPIGIPTLRYFFPLLFSEGVAKGRLSLATLTQLACADPAKLAGLYPTKGTLQVGSDADLVIFNPDASYNPEEETPDFANPEFADPFIQTTFQGMVESVFLRGQPVLESGKLVKERVRPKYLKRRLNLP